MCNAKEEERSNAGLRGGTAPSAVSQLFNHFVAEVTPASSEVLALRQDALNSLQELCSRDIGAFRHVVIELFSVVGVLEPQTQESICGDSARPPKPQPGTTIPDYRPDDELWITAQQCAGIERVLVASLAAYRKKYNAVYMAPDRMCGVDRDGSYGDGLARGTAGHSTTNHHFEGLEGLRFVLRAGCAQSLA